MPQALGTVPGVWMLPERPGFLESRQGGSGDRSGDSVNTRGQPETMASGKVVRCARAAVGVEVGVLQAASGAVETLGTRSESGGRFSGLCT